MLGKTVYKCRKFCQKCITIFSWLARTVTVSVVVVEPRIHNTVDSNGIYSMRTGLWGMARSPVHPEDQSCEM